MVKIDLGIKELIGLAELNSISKNKLKDYLDEFNKDVIINYLASSVFDSEEKEDDTSEDLDKGPSL